MARVLIFLAMAVVLGVPFAVRPPEAKPARDAERLVIITPHVEPIRIEFARVFDEWHRATHGEAVVIDWRVPGGTSDIQKQLKAIYQGAIVSGQLTGEGELAAGFGPLPFDLFFGGGTFEHNETKKGVTARPAKSEKDVTLSMSVPAGIEPARLREWLGANELGAGFLYDPGNAEKGDPGQYWIGTAASGFGIVYNRDVLRRLKLPDPTRWEDLCHPSLQGWVALADPRQSGSVATLYDSILNNYGWERGWRTLREMAANSRTFTNSSPKVPLDVSQGEAAMGVAISHYGRFQAQAVMKPGESPEESRVGYIDPPGVVYIDADPISLMRGGANPVVARRFIEFCLSEAGQALWQFHVRPAGVAAVNGSDPATWGPTRFELRRMSVRRDLFEKHRDRMVDKVSPFEAASTVKEKGWRSAVAPMMGAFGIDTHAELVAAWSAYNRARAGGAADAATIEKMESLLYALPEWDLNGVPTAFNEANYRAIRDDWRKAERDGRMPAIRAGWIRFFRANYAEVVRLGG